MTDENRPYNKSSTRVYSQGAYLRRKEKGPLRFKLALEPK